MSATLLILAATLMASRPELGLAEGTCRPNESGPAILVLVEGLKDRRGRLRLELYPANDDDFLADDNALLAAGKTFARVDAATPPSGSVELCIRVPAAGRFALSLLHDRDSNHRFDIGTDGIGFAGNPRIGWSKPRADAATVVASAGLTRIAIIPAYRHGLLMRPEARR